MGHYKLCQEQAALVSLRSPKDLVIRSIVASACLQHAPLCDRALACSLPFACAQMTTRMKAKTLALTAMVCWLLARLAMITKLKLLFTRCWTSHAHQHQRQKARNVNGIIFRQHQHRIMVSETGSVFTLATGLPCYYVSCTDLPGCPATLKVRLMSTNSDGTPSYHFVVDIQAASFHNHDVTAPGDCRHASRSSPIVENILLRKVCR
jgi:hypothetical protein